MGLPVSAVPSTATPNVLRKGPELPGPPELGLLPCVPVIWKVHGLPCLLVLPSPWGLCGRTG